MLEKFAVRMGGGVNHRLSLSQAALIKDNHIMAAGSISDAFNAIKKMYPDKSIEIEVDSIDQLKEAITLKPDLILLDNMSTNQCSEAVSITNGLVKLEASGGITITNAKAYAATGVDYLAIGSLTHSAPALDIGLDFRKGK
jgi:nicotinate-nucleotide pyrophosphorylase (carboxylating)